MTAVSKPKRRPPRAPTSVLRSRRGFSRMTGYRVHKTGDWRLKLGAWSRELGALGLETGCGYALQVQALGYGFGMVAVVRSWIESRITAGDAMDRAPFHS